MSTYKNNVLHDNPITFWTFDFDNQILPSNEIIDEIGNANPLFVSGTNFEMRQLSLNDLEVTDQYSISLAKEEKVGGSWTTSTTLECPHASIYNLGEFSLEFLINKKSANVIRDAGEIGQYSTIASPIIRKTGLMEMVIVDSYGGAEHIQLTVLDHVFTYSEFQSANALRPIFDINNHVVVKYKAEQIDVNEYETTASLYLNGSLVASDTLTYFDSFPVSATTSSWLIGSNGGSNPLTDYQTEELKLDQIAIYDYPLTDEQISTHYRKTQRYEDLIKLDKPDHFVRFNDLDNVSDNAINSINPVYPAVIYGNYVREQLATEKVIDAKATYFFNGGVCAMGKLNSQSYLTPNFIQTQQDYTVEFWFKTPHSKRGSLLSAISDTPNWHGLNIFINSKNDFETLGSIQVSESADVKFNSELTNFNDDKWHHLVVIRSGNFIKLYIDSDLQGELQSSPFSGTHTRELYLMAQAPNSLNVDGSLSDFAIYDYAMQEMMINSRFHFATRHRIFGHTLLEGAPVQAKVRFYNSYTGEKVGEVLSSQGTGEYLFYPYSDRQLDIVALIPDNQTTRYRVHAPITPAEFDDSHLQS